MLKYVYVLFASLLLMGCSDPLPQELRTDANRTLGSIENLKKTIKVKKASYEKLTKSEDWDFWKPISIKEKWSEKVNVTKDELDALDKSKKNISVLLRGNKAEHRSKMRNLISAANTMTDGYRTRIEYPFQRYELISDVKKNTKRYMKEIKEIRKKSEKNMDDFQVVVSKAEKDYPDKNKKIKNQYDMTIAQYGKLVESLNGFDDAIENKVYGEVASNYSSAIERSAEFDENIRYFNTINNSEIRILNDIEKRYNVIVGRTSWRESIWIEYPIETNYEYEPIVISETIYNKIKKKADNFICKDEMFGSNPILFMKGFCNKNMRGDDNKAEYYLLDDWVSYHHQVTDYKNGELVETKWVDLEDSTNKPKEYYEATSKAVGMQISQNSIGDFEDVINVEPTPLGLDVVGDEISGEWRKNDQGESFWYYYGQYSFMNNMMFGSPYYYSDYDYYRNRDRSYYGYYNGGSRYYGQATARYTPPKQNAVYRNAAKNGSTFAQRQSMRKERASGRNFRNGSKIRGGGSGRVK